MPQLTMYRMGLILVAIPLLGQLAFTWFVASIQRSAAEAQAQSFHSKEVLKQAQVVLTSLLDAETGARSFVFTSDPAFAEPYRTAIRTSPIATQSLRELVSDNPAQAKLASSLGDMASDLLEWHTAQVNLVESGEPAQAIERVRAGEGKRQMDVFRGEIRRFMDEEERLDRERELALTAWQPAQRSVLLGGSVGAFLLMALVAAVFSRGIVGRLSRLQENVELFRQAKELRAPLPGSDEIAALDQAFRTMAADLARATQSLQQSLAEVNDLYNHAPCGYHSIDIDGRIVAVNDTELDWLGYSRAEVLGKKRFQDFLSPEGQQTFDDSFERFKTAGVVNNLEVEVLRKDGRRIPVLLNATSIRDGEGKYLASRTTMFDITDRKVLELELSRLNRDLEDRVASRTSDLASANRELLHKNGEIETFVYSVSHDLRSPLVNLQGFAKELELTARELRVVLADPRVPPEVHRQATALLDKDVAESIRFIQTGVMRLSSIIDALLRLSRAGRIELHLEPVDVQAMVSRIVDSLRVTIDEKKIEVVAGQLPGVWADPSSLEQILSNLIGNATKYLDPSRPARIEIGSVPPENGENTRTYFVRDNGLGIPQSGLEKVFQAFQRMHPSAASGEGMGLAIVRRMVERYMGRVWVESEPGRGSTFYITIPNVPRNGSGKDPSTRHRTSTVGGTA